jgi:hypothetical protein
MGARQPSQPEFNVLDSNQRKKVVWYAEEMVGDTYAWYETINFLFGMAKGDYVKGTNSDGEIGYYNCVGLTEAAYEFAGVNGGVGLVTEEDEGNNCFVFLSGMTSPTCVLTPKEQYKETEIAEGYSVSGQVIDSQGNGISDVTLNFELVTYSFSVNTNENGNWDCGRTLGREWNVTPQKDGYTFEPSTIKVTGNANDINFKSISEPEILTPEEIELIREWGYGGDYVARWPDGYVGVHDETNYSRMQEVINEWNDAINGPVKFYLSSNPNSPVKVMFDSSLALEGFCGNDDVIWGDDYAFSEVTLKVNPSESCCESYNIKYCLYLIMFNAAVGFNYGAEVSPTPFEDWSNFNTIPITIKTMLHALYKVPPGYYLGDSKQRKDHSNNVIKNIFINGDRNCTDEGNK